MIKIRKLVALDMAVHSPTFIVIEFVIGVLGIPALGLYSLFKGGTRMGLYLLGIGINYLPLLVYAVIIARKRSANREAAYELSHKPTEAKRYLVGQLILLAPFIVVPLALYQEIFQAKGSTSK